MSSKKWPRFQFSKGFRGDLIAKVFQPITPYSIKNRCGHPTVYKKSYDSAADMVFLVRHSSSANECHFPRRLARLGSENKLETSVCLESISFGQIQCHKETQLWEQRPQNDIRQDSVKPRHDSCAVCAMSGVTTEYASSKLVQHFPISSTNPFISPGHSRPFNNACTLDELHRPTKAASPIPHQAPTILRTHPR